MQCLQLTRGDPPATPLKWYFNKTIALPKKGTEWKINFTLGSDTTEYHKLRVTLANDGGLTLCGYYYIYMGQQFQTSKDLYSDRNGWFRSSYRTITFDAPPTGDLLAWLKANATPQ